MNKIKYYLFILICFVSACTQAFAHKTEQSPNADDDLETQSDTSLTKEPVPDKKLAFILENELKIQHACNQRKGVIKINDTSILCFDGYIEKTHLEPVITGKEPFSIAYINSGGGDVLAAMTLGRKIHNNDAYLIIDKNCHSSCSNYLIPAAKKLYITDNTVITMHGNPPRNKLGFIGSVLRAEGIKREDVVKDMSILFDRLNNKKDYQKHVKEFVLVEVKYFSYIGINEAYVTRFNEIKRTLKVRKNYVCNPPKGLFLIIGPEYLNEFYISVVRPWFPHDKSKYVELLSGYEDNYSLLFDFEEDPFWLSGRGLVSKQDCYIKAEEQL